MGHAKKQESIPLAQGKKTVNRNILLGNPNVRLTRQICVTAIINIVKD